MVKRTLFEQIISGDLPSEKVFENERLIAIKDINPIAPVHLLIISKKVIPDLQSVLPEDLGLIAEIVGVAQELARQFKVEKEYRLLTNTGREAGQSVFHLHFHLIGGHRLGKIG